MKLTDRERGLLQSAICDRIVADYRTSCNPCVSKAMSEVFAKDCEEKHELFKKLGGVASVEDLVKWDVAAKEKVETFVRDRRISL